MSEANDASGQRPEFGSCPRCGCPLGAHAAGEPGRRYCCGPCRGSDRCSCGCGRGPTRRVFTDQYVPVRRMFAARPPDELRESARWERMRAFPFADSRRGR